MAESLNVISLISGGKDSFFSILHCMRNGHKVVALANLYPVTPPSKPNADAADGREETEQDLNSFMFQTVGHTVIPLYEQALGIPLYRQPIIGSAVQTGASYSHYRTPEASSVELEDGAADETESLVPLLKKIISEHPSVQAISTGAILSTYQRTRVESVALRLGLTPLSYLWKYPVLPPGIQTSLLEDMQAAGLDARIVKVASGGLDESFLWQNVASGNVVRRIERAMGRFGADGDGAVLGEGGEFETLVVDGPRCLFKKRIKVQDGDWRVVREGGGSAWLRLLGAELMVKAPEATTQVDCRIPELLDQRFEDILDTLHKDNLPDRLTGAEAQTLQHIPPYDLPSHLPLPAASEGDVLYWTITSSHSCQDISDEAGEIVAELRQYLNRSSLQASDIISTTIILRSMQDFQVVNQVSFPTHYALSATNPSGLRGTLHPTQPSCTRHNLMWRSDARRHQHHNPPQNLHLGPPPPQSIARPIPLILGPRQHRTLLPSNIHLTLHSALLLLHPTTLDRPRRRPNPPNPIIHASCPSQLPNPHSPRTAAPLPHRRRHAGPLVDQRRGIPAPLATLTPPSPRRPRRSRLDPRPPARRRGREPGSGPRSLGGEARRGTAAQQACIENGAAGLGVRPGRPERAAVLRGRGAGAATRERGGVACAGGCGGGNWGRG